MEVVVHLMQTMNLGYAEGRVSGVTGELISEDSKGVIVQTKSERNFFIPLHMIAFIEIEPQGSDDD